ncbi:hypothetical protein BDZ89DRAFT_1110563, partial [Hymenopellis radicata]
MSANGLDYASESFRFRPSDDKWVLIHHHLADVAKFDALEDVWPLGKSAYNLLKRLSSGLQHNSLREQAEDQELGLLSRSSVLHAVKMIIDEKFILAAPPPPYVSPQTSIVLGSNNPYNPYRRSFNVSLPALPPHLLLQVVYSTFPQALAVGTSDGELFALQRENLYWLETSLRLVNRALYIACMHILRSTYLPTYDRLVKAPYTSDPFPASSSELSSPSIILKHHRELTTLDRFIALLAREERLLDATELHLPCEEAYRDMFDFMQPRSRLEDLVAKQGQLRGMIYIDCPRPRLAPSSPAPSTLTLRSNDSSTSLKKLADDDEQQPRSSSCSIRNPSFLFVAQKKPVPIYTPPAPPQPTTIEPIPFSTLSVAFSPRKVGLVYTPPAPSPAIPSTTTSIPSRSSSSSSSAYGGSTYGSLSMSMNAHIQRKKTLVEITRTRDETLESCAKRLVQALLIRMEE